MRLLDKKLRWAIGLGLTVSLAGCGFIGADQSLNSASSVPAVMDADTASGPEGDFPVVLGDAFKVDGVEYIPSNSWNYDSVGYATAMQAEGVSASHKTLPLPSYVEVTSLQSGKTVLVRVSERGIVLGDGRVEVAWSRKGESLARESHFADGAHDGKIELPELVLQK